MAGARKHIRSSTADKRPTTAIEDGQLAVNTNAASPGLFFKDSTGATIIKVGPVHVGTTAPNAVPPTGGSSGNSSGEVWLDISLTPPGVKIWDGGAWVNATPAGSTTVQGLLELATNAETQAGADTARAVTPAALQSKVSDSTSTASSTTIASSAAVKSAYDLANAALPKSGGTVTGNLEIGTTGTLTFEGSTADGFETTLGVVDPTADRTITLPNTTGTVITTGDTGTVTSTMIADGAIVNADINASAAIAPSKLGSGALPNGVTVSSTNIVDGTIVNADVNASAAIAGSKISPDFAEQNVVTTGSITGASLIPSSATVPTNGVYLPAVNSVAISTNGTRRLIITSDGKVGLGSASVLQQGSAIDGGSGAGILELYNGATGNTTLENTGAFPIIFKTNGSERMRLDSSGRLGLGTSSPGFKLTIEDATTPRIRIGDGTRHLNVDGGSTTQNAAIGTDYAGSFGIYTNGAANTRLHVTSAGNVGIGTTSPNERVDAGSGNFVTSGYYICSSSGRLRLRNSNNNNYSEIYNPETGSGAGIAFVYGGGEAARIDSSGRLLVGTSSSTTGAEGQYAKLQVIGNSSGVGGGAYITFGKDEAATGITADEMIARITFGNTGPAEFAYISCQADGTAGSGDYPGRLVFSTTADGASSPTEAMRINNAGGLLVGYTSDFGAYSAYKLQVNSQIFATSATIATSDGRYKENVVTLDGCVDLVKALRPVSFDWKHQEPITRIDEEGKTVVVREAHNFPDGTQVGFIAQEVETVLADKPWLGSVIKQNVRPAVTDNDGNELAPEEEFLGIAEGNLVAVLTSALKDAIGEIESLKARVAAAGI